MKTLILAIAITTLSLSARAQTTTPATSTNPPPAFTFNAATVSSLFAAIGTNMVYEAGMSDSLRNLRGGHFTFNAQLDEKIDVATVTLWGEVLHLGIVNAQDFVNGSTIACLGVGIDGSHRPTPASVTGPVKTVLPNFIANIFDNWTWHANIVEPDGDLIKGRFNAGRMLVEFGASVAIGKAPAPQN